MKIDILELNIPNVCFSIADQLEDSDKIKKFKEQREERGFDDTEVYNLDSTIARFILPRLKRYKELNNIVPTDLTEELGDY